MAYIVTTFVVTSLSSQSIVTYVCASQFFLDPSGVGVALDDINTSLATYFQDFTSKMKYLWLSLENGYKE